MYDRDLRIGVLLDDFEGDKWLGAMLAQIRALDFADITLVVKNASYPPRSGRSLVGKIRHHKLRAVPILLHKLLTRVFHRFFDRPPPDLDSAFAKTDLRAVLAGVPVIEVQPIQKKFSDSFPDADLEAIAEHNVDLFLRAGFRILKGQILTAAPLGVWSFHHGDHRINRGGPAGFWEVVQQWPETGSILQILTTNLDGGRVLYQSTSCTDTRSVHENQNNNFWKSLRFIPRKLKELHALGERKFLTRVADRNAFPEFYSRRLYVEATNAELLSIIVKGLARKVRRRIVRTFYFEQWILLTKRGQDMASRMASFQRIVPPKDRFWADPFVVERDGRFYVFIEEFPYAAGKGHISVMESEDGRAWSTPTPVLVKDFHLSYPHLVESGGRLYMIPASPESKTIDLYRCVAFPDTWEHHQTLIRDVEASDATLLHHDGRWWLFACVVEQPGASSSDELHIYSSDALESDTWQPHPLNPVVSDVTRARPAGNIVKARGRLFRAAQNCAPRYGYGFGFYEIQTLSGHEYSEVLRTKVEPKWERDLLGTHTYNHTPGLSVSDAIIRRPKYW